MLVFWAYGAYGVCGASWVCGASCRAFGGFRGVGSWGLGFGVYVLRLQVLGLRGTGTGFKVPTSFITIYKHYYFTKPITLD